MKEQLLRKKLMLPVTLSEAFAKSAIQGTPDRGEIINFFAWATTKAWENPKIRKRTKVDDLIHYWTAINNHQFEQKQLMNILKGLSALYCSDKISEEVKGYFRTNTAFAPWFNQYHNLPHTLHLPFMLECMDAFDKMSIEPAQTFLQDLENTQAAAIKPASDERANQISRRSQDLILA